MNYYGSSRHLVKNSKAALLCAIEVYNKPQIEYREECFVILLLNAWELLLKAILSKRKVKIFYSKDRNQPYKTLSWKDAFLEAQKFFPKGFDPLPVRSNLDMLGTYRDNAVHFYNQGNFFVVIYALAQTSIVNFKDLLVAIFGQDLSEDITWQLLPLGLSPPVDPITYISSQENLGLKQRRSPVGHFLSALLDATTEVAKAGKDTGRLLTTFTMKLESTKKIKKADFVVGVGAAGVVSGPLTIVKTADPNVTHPLRQKEILEAKLDISGKRLTAHVLQAIVWKHEIKSKARFCWVASEGVLTRYSHDFVSWLKRLTHTDVNLALKSYKQRNKSRALKRKQTK